MFTVAMALSKHKRTAAECHNYEKKTLEKRKLFDFSPDEQKRLREWIREEKKKSCLRQECRKRAREILDHLDAFSIMEIPMDKWIKLLRAAGDYNADQKLGAFLRDENVEDLDKDSYFGNAATEQQERAAIINEINEESVSVAENSGEAANGVENYPPILIEDNVLDTLDAPSLYQNTPDHQLPCSMFQADVETAIIDLRAKSVTAPLLIHPDTVRSYLEFLACDPVVSRFMRYDYCRQLSDKYLLAVVCVFFVRAGLPSFSPDAFFKFLYLANETHEDEEDLRFNICAWVLGKNWRDDYSEFMEQRLIYWRLLQYETIVLRPTLEQLFTVDPTNPVWMRERAEYHAGANRHSYIRDEMEFSPAGDFKTPNYCGCCAVRLSPSNLPTKLQHKVPWQNKNLPPKKRRIMCEKN